jgi:hypothetical protein
MLNSMQEEMFLCKTYKKNAQKAFKKQRQEIRGRGIEKKKK